ncbi:MAG: tRNA 4-thiouridine(8) synthase ThiI [Nanoarchaeota archaeon]|nr:tRNA 4-thiouridine(8) synthase ThiI [Nanoarchaeota archaeon]
MNSYIVIHYHEIGLKGKNRLHFIKMLINNVKKKCEPMEFRYIIESGQVTLEIEKKDEKKYSEILDKIPGIAFFSIATRTTLDLDDIKNEVITVLKKKDFSTFRITTKRHDKNHGTQSQEVNRQVGAEVVEKLKKKVSLKEPELTVKIETTFEHSYISFQDVPGCGGLPTDQRQKVVALLSGGFDSPVAAYMMMKRGCEVILVHFHNKNVDKTSVESKIKQLAKQLSKFQLKTKLIIVPFDEIQKEIIVKVNSTLRMLVYRRFMIKIASMIAKDERARFLVVGDSLSQVASQTFNNLRATYHGEEIHILSPVIGLDKDEIIKITRRIGTFDISAQPAGDCCSFFLAKHPELKSDVKTLLRIEEGIDVDKFVKEAIEKIRVVEC